MKAYLVTGGAGFIGSNFVLRERKIEKARIVNLDLLTYAGNVNNLNSLRGDRNHIFVKGDIADRELVRELLAQYQPAAVIHFAAESHVDRSIDGPADFIRTNVVGTFHLLEEARRYWDSLSAEEKKAFRFVHISTDEVYGSLGPNDPPFREDIPYAPNSPYSASKAASDPLVRAYFPPYGFPTVTTNCSNNYGPMQFPEKLIPLVILNALEGKSLPIYGDGLNIRDWLYVEDHCEAIGEVLDKGRVGETYNIGGHCEKSNLEMVKTICAILDELCPESPYAPHDSLITFVKDRPGHDRRYAIDSSRIGQELGWTPKESLETGLRKTIEWYLSHKEWVKDVKTGAYQDWLAKQYG